MNMSITVTSWLHAADLFKGARDKDYGRVLDKNTRLRVSSQVHGRYSKDLNPSEIVYSIVHFRTEIIQIYSNGTYGITPQGWDTTTTKKRIRQHSPVGLYKMKDGAWLGNYGWGIPVETDGCYIVDAMRRTIRDTSGVEVRQTANVGPPRPLPKHRNPLSKPVRGDLLRSPSGEHWVVGSTGSGETKRLHLVEYIGDMPARRKWAAVGTTTLELSPLFLLTIDGWRAVPRFVLGSEVNHGA
jgi:hypothetical protein